MILERYVNVINWNDIEFRFVELYPDYKHVLDKFEDAFKILKVLKPEKPIEELTILIEFFENETEGWHEVTGYIESKDQMFGISFQKWEKWLGMEINQQTKENYNDTDILIHCFWEMTYYGFSPEEIQKAKEELEKPVEYDSGFVTITLSNGVVVNLPETLTGKKREELLEFLSELALTEKDQDEFIEKLKKSNKI